MTNKTLSDRITEFEEDIGRMYEAQEHRDEPDFTQAKKMEEIMQLINELQAKLAEAKHDLKWAEYIVDKLQVELEEVKAENEALKTNLKFARMNMVVAFKPTTIIE